MATLFSKKFLKVPKIPFLGMFHELGRNAFVDWIWILFVNILVMVALILFGFYLHWQLSTGHFQTTEVVPTTEAKIFDEKELDKITGIFQAKEDASSQIKRGYRGPSDPGL